jgi:hypothetical protein
METTKSGNYKLGKCSNCGHQVSLLASGCPACGMAPSVATPAKSNWKLNVLGGVAIGGFLLVSGIKACAVGETVTPAQVAMTREISSEEATPEARPAYDWCVDEATMDATRIGYRDAGVSFDDNQELALNNEPSDMERDLGHEPEEYGLKMERTDDQVRLYALNLMYAHRELTQREVQQATLDACHKFCAADETVSCDAGIGE